MTSPGYTVVRNGLFLPGGTVSRLDVVYSAEYRLVPESCLIRGKENPINVSNAPENLPETIRLKLEHGDIQHETRTVLFLGAFATKHYGHLLTEGIARYWYLSEHRDLGAIIPAPYNPFGLRSHLEDLLKPQESHWKAFLAAFGIGSNEIIVTRTPIQASEIVVPHPSMINRGQIFPSHAAVTKRLAMHVARLDGIIPDPSPVYLSRSKFIKRGKKQYLGEVSIEAACKAHGCKVVYPEQLSLKEQVILFNTHDTFIGFNGSAFHSVLFRVVNRKARNIYLLDSADNSNFHLIDGLMRNEAYYIPCRGDAIGDLTWKVNYEKAEEGLAALLGWS